MSSDMSRVVPKPRKPLYPDVPWWAVLITAFVFSIVGVVVGVYSGGFGTAAGEAAKSMTAAGIVVDTISYTPHILLLFGVLADMFTLQGVWSIPSLVGVLSIFANKLFEYFWRGLSELVGMAQTVAAGKTPPPETPAGGKRKGGALFAGYTGCSVQGFETWQSEYAPQTLVVTATVFAYYCFDLIQNRGWINSLGAILAFFTAFFAQAAIVGMQTDGAGCGKTGVVTPAIRALSEGLLFGGVSYAIVQTYAPARLPSSTISPFPAKSASELSPGPDGKMYDADGYPYVVLPNGMAVPDVSDASARAAFGEMAADATGTASSLASNCPGKAAPCPA